MHKQKEHIQYVKKQYLYLIKMMKLMNKKILKKILKLKEIQKEMFKIYKN